MAKNTPTATMYGVYVKGTNTCLGMWYNKIVAQRRAERAHRIAPAVEYEIRATIKPFTA